MAAPRTCSIMHIELSLCGFLADEINTEHVLRPVCARCSTSMVAFTDLIFCANCKLNNTITIWKWATDEPKTPLFSKQKIYFGSKTPVIEFNLFRNVWKHANLSVSMQNLQLIYFGKNSAWFAFRLSHFYVAKWGREFGMLAKLRIFFACTYGSKLFHFLRIYVLFVNHRQPRPHRLWFFALHRCILFGRHFVKKSMCQSYCVFTAVCSDKCLTIIIYLHSNGCVKWIK